jgi:PAP2 superfamily
VKRALSLLKARYWHYSIGLLLSLALVPLLRSLHLPIQFDWVNLGTAYWLVLAAQSIFVAAVLGVMGFPRQAILLPFLERYRREPLRIALVLLYLGILGSAFTWMKAVVLTVDTLAVLEFRERRKSELLPTATAVLLPALYLFAGFLLLFAYNDIIASVRFNFSYDPFFSALDKLLLHGGSVSALSRWAVQTFPLPFFRFLEFIYFGMFPQIGAAIILTSVYGGRKLALQFVGSILLAYYLALGMFYLWPSAGPYYLCFEHFERFPQALQTYSIQKLLIMHALALWNHVPIHRISTDYFIAFPCMHIAQPLIVMWFLRRRKPVVIALCAYDAVLIVAILLLEWHYVVDLIGGVVVAAISIALTSYSISRREVVQGDSKKSTSDIAFSR